MEKRKRERMKCNNGSAISVHEIVRATRIESLRPFLSIRHVEFRVIALTREVTSSNSISSGVKMHDRNVNEPRPTNFKVFLVALPALLVYFNNTQVCILTIR